MAFFILFALLGAHSTRVFAHPADVYTHIIKITITEKKVSVNWQVKPGPMLVSFLWHEADANGDDSVSDAEARQWAESRVKQLNITKGGARLPLKLDAVHFPSGIASFQAADDFITFDLSADWETSNESFLLFAHNGLEEAKSLNWFYVNATDGLKFESPKQQNTNLAVKIYPPALQANVQAPLTDAWDSSRPSLDSWQGGTPAEPSSTEQAPAAQENTPQNTLIKLVKTNQFSAGFYVFALSVSLFLGALHALTPGHGKTVVAAYLVGSRGTTYHAVVLGAVVTLTHTGSVFLLGIVTLAASKYILPTTIIPWLEVLSGVLILWLGIYLFWQRFTQWRASLKPKDDAPRKRVSLAPASSAKKPAGSIKIQKADASLHHHHGDGKLHSHEVPESITWRSLIALGVSGGLVPCPDAIAILLVAVAINRILLGLALIVSFSLGLAVVLIVIGLLMVNSRRLFDRFDAFNKFTPFMPVISAAVVTVLGIALTWGAYVRMQADAGLTGTGSALGGEAGIIYIAEDGNKVKQLFTANADGTNPAALTKDANEVSDYAISTDGSRVIYAVQTVDFTNEIWVADVAGGLNQRVVDCGEAMCSNFSWSPDGSHVAYEFTSIADANATGLPTVYWIDMKSLQAQPLFQESLPGGNPRWSHDGKWLSYTTPDGLVLYSFETGESQVVKSTLGAPGVWSPDDSQILFRDVIIKNGQFVSQLFVYNLKTKEMRNLLPDAGFENLLAAWSPDGTQIAVVRRDLSVTRGDQIWVFNADNGAARMLTKDEAVLHGSLNWSANGVLLLVDVYPLDIVPLQAGLQVIDVATGNITGLNIDGYAPKWIP